MMWAKRLGCDEGRGTVDVRSEVEEFCSFHGKGRPEQGELDHLGVKSQAGRCDASGKIDAVMGLSGRARH